MNTWNVRVVHVARGPEITRIAVIVDASAGFVVVHPTVFPVTLPADPFAAAAGSSDRVDGAAVV
jgi:hypothetical protein